MKKENQASKFEGTLDLRRHPIDPEHYHTVAKATAQALADKISRRYVDDKFEPGQPIIRTAAVAVLLEWFTGKFTPGGPTDP